MLNSHSVNSPPEFRSLSLSVRPARVATFFVATERWADTAHSIMEVYSRIWGGAGNIIIPVARNGQMRNVFRHLLRLFDPDFVALYYPTPHDLRLRAPQLFAKYCKCRTQRLHEQSFPDNAIKNYLQRWEFETSHWELPKETTHAVLQSCAPFHHKDHNPFIALSVDTELSPNLTDMLHITPNSIRDITNYNTSGIADPFSLMIASNVGHHTDIAIERLSKRGVKCRNENLVINQDTDWPTCCWRTWRQRNMEDRQLNWHSTPMGRTLTGTRPYYNARTGLLQPAYTQIIVVGDGVEDFCLWIALHRMTGMAYWLPRSILCNSDTIAMSYRRALARYISRHRLYRSEQYKELNTFVTTVTDFELKSTRDIRDYFTKKSKSDLQDYIDLFSAEIRFAPPEEIRIAPIYRHRDEGVDFILRNEPFRDCQMESITGLDTPLPHSLRTDEDSQLQWVVDVAINGYQPPVRAGLNSLMNGGTKWEQYGIRTSTDGITYLSQRQGATVGSKFRNIVARPRLRIPRARACFEALFDRVGYTCELSDKGYYSLGVVSLWGELEHLAADLTDSVRSRLLDGFRGTKSKERTIGWVVDGRRFLSFINACLEMKVSRDDARQIIDQYVSRGILNRGFILICQRCRHTSWYDADDVGKIFRCSRCRAENLVTSKTWKESLEPRVYYGLNELVFQFLENNGDVPIAALNRLAVDAYAFDFCPELRLLRGSEQHQEIDILAIVEGRIVLGEAKRTERLAQQAKAEEKSLMRLRSIATKVGADIVCFATAAKEWRAQTKNNINKFFSKVPVELKILEDVLGSVKS